jgi:hypothetical protein
LNQAYVNSSEQDTLDCSGEGSCSGGWWAFQNLIDKGAAEENNYPYVAEQGPCQTGVDRPFKGVAWGYVDDSVEIPSTDALKKALCEYGPLAVAVYVSPAFQAYTSGVFNENAAGQVNHGVTLTGWDDERKAWRIKNSWGEGWGENGFMWIGWGCNSIGYAAAWTQAEASAVCEDGPSLLAHEEFYTIDNKQFSANANVTSVTFNLPREMFVSVVADASAFVSEGNASEYFKTGLYSKETPDTMWTASFRIGSFVASGQHLPVHTAMAMKLPAGTHTMYWKIWVRGYTIEFDSGTLTAIAVPCSMGGKLRAASLSESGKETLRDGDEIITTKDEDRPNMYVTIDRSPGTGC